MVDAARPTWRQHAAHVASVPPFVNAGLALGGARLSGARVRPWLAFHGGLVEDVDAALTGAFSVTGWRAAWAAVAKRRESIAAEAAREGRDATAFRHGVAAALAYQTAPYLAPRDLAARRQLLGAGALAHADAVTRAPWRVRKLTIPWKGHALPGYLHLPRGLPADARPPVVVVENTIGHYKETWTGLARALGERGVATLAFDSPGTGERSDLTPPLHSEEVLSPVLDFLRGLDEVDGERAGLHGISLAGNLVARAAAMDPRWRAVVSITPPFDPSRYARTLPRFILDLLAVRTKLTRKEVVEAARELSLARVADRITQPIFTADASHDFLIPPGEGERLVEAASSKEKKVVISAHRGGHAVARDFHRVMDESADYLARHLRAAR